MRRLQKVLSMLIVAASLLSSATLFGCNKENSNQENAVFEKVDFLVDVAEDKDPVVLQLSDTQIIDAAQERTPERLTAKEEAYWKTEFVENRCYAYIRETVQAAQPDLIILTGDVVYGEFDDSGAALTGFVAFMEGLGVPWAPVFGNHDNESAKGADWQCARFEEAEHCLFKQRTLAGNGNYTVGIRQSGELKRIFFMLDSNGCAGMSAASRENGHTYSSNGFGSDQIAWYTEVATSVKTLSPNTKISFAYHIQQYVFMDAYEKYGFINIATQEYPINIDKLATKEEGDFGYLGRDLKGPWDSDRSIWQGMKALGTDSVFVGHEHCNSASVVYDGVRFQFGQKSSTYDRANYIKNGEIVGLGASGNGLTPLVGGTVIPLSKEDGSIKSPYIYLCKDKNGNEVILP